MRRKNSLHGKLALYKVEADTIPYPTHPYLPHPSLPARPTPSYPTPTHLIPTPRHTLPPPLPCPAMPCPTLPYPTLPYPTLPYPTLPYPTPLLLSNLRKTSSWTMVDPAKYKAEDKHQAPTHWWKFTSRYEKGSMTRKYQNHTLQTNPLHYEVETPNVNRDMTARRQLNMSDFWGHRVFVSHSARTLHVFLIP